jgi:threonine aldolase
MRRAIADAEVGDEQRGEDPSTRALEERAAQLLGHEAAIFVPTATMANQIALKVLSEPADEVLAEADAHVFRSELGGPAFHSGLAMKRIAGHRGLFSPEQVRDAVNPAEVHLAPTRLLCLENTHNGGGGKIWPLALVREVCAEARRHGLAVHLDGARLMNAAVASGVSSAEYGKEFDTVTLCLSKGLGYPLGAVLAGSTEHMAKARRYKHLFGGAMRQSGIAAAAGVYALEHHVDRLAEDHANARRLATGLAEAGLPADPEETETNFVLLDAGALGLTAPEAAALLAEQGLLMSAAIRRGCLRAVTHLDVNADDVERAIEAATKALAGRSAAAATA